MRQDRLNPDGNTILFGYKITTKVTDKKDMPMILFEDITEDDKLEQAGKSRDEDGIVTVPLSQARVERMQQNYQRSRSAPLLERFARWIRSFAPRHSRHE